MVNIPGVLRCKNTADTKSASLLDQNIQRGFAGGCIGVRGIESSLASSSTDLVQKEQQARSVSAGSTTLFAHPSIDSKGNLGNDETLVLEIGNVREIDNTDLCFTIDSIGPHQFVILISSPLTQLAAAPTSWPFTACASF